MLYRTSIDSAECRSDISGAKPLYKGGKIMKDYYDNKKLTINICLMLIGIVVWGLAFSGKLPSGYWDTLGVTLVIIEALQIARNLRYRKDAEYKKKIDIESGDERNSYIRLKAWSYTGYLFVIGAALISLILYIAGKEEIGRILSYCMCAELVIFYVSYLILSRKY